MINSTWAKDGPFLHWPDMRTIELEIDPMPSPRPRVYNGHAVMSPLYKTWKEQFGFLWKAKKGPETFESIAITFYISIPDSYTKKKRNELHLAKHHVKPDLDNLVKSVFDAITGTDQVISDLWAQKRWIDGPGKIVVLCCETLPLIDPEQLERRDEN